MFIAQNHVFNMNPVRIGPNPQKLLKNKRRVRVQKDPILFFFLVQFQELINQTLIVSEWRTQLQLLGFPPLSPSSQQTESHLVWEKK